MAPRRSGQRICLLKHQLLIARRCRRRDPNLRFSDRLPWVGFALPASASAPSHRHPHYTLHLAGRTRRIEGKSMPTGCCLLARDSERSPTDILTDEQISTPLISGSNSKVKKSASFDSNPDLNFSSKSRALLSPNSTGFCLGDSASRSALSKRQRIWRHFTGSNWRQFCGANTGSHWGQV